MKVITQAQLEDHIEGTVKGTTFVSLVSETDPRMVKKHRETGEANPYLGAVKTQKKNGIIGFDYGSNVNAQAVREGKEQREAHSRTWGELSASRLFVHHKGKSYLQMRVQSVGDTTYTLNGEVIPMDDIKPFLPIKHVSSTQDDLNKTIIVNDLKMDSIKVITVGKETFAIAPQAMTGATPQGKVAQVKKQTVTSN